MDIILVIFILIYSAILHEIMHGFIAYRLGDPTAKLLGRLTLNPVKHLDIFYSLLLPLGLFFSHLPIIGGAKPVPVDPFNLRDRRKDMALVSLAGPLTNVILAILGTLILKIIGSNLPDEAFTIVIMVITYNVSLAIFNLLPIPPLDGSKIAALLLPEREANQYLSLGRFGMIIIFLLLFFYGSFLFTLYSFALKLLGL